MSFRTERERSEKFSKGRLRRPKRLRWISRFRLEMKSRNKIGCVM